MDPLTLQWIEKGGLIALCAGCVAVIIALWRDYQAERRRYVDLVEARGKERVEQIHDCRECAKSVAEKFSAAWERSNKAIDQNTVVVEALKDGMGIYATLERLQQAVSEARKET